tara:strand:- start:138 stop:593 length:456 start_codon:yes stop_codon:yes gene_type:complete
MASTISAATLTVTHTEALTLNGVDRGVTNTLTIASVNEVDHRIMTIPTGSLSTVVSMGAAAAAGTFINSGVKYIRITNKDDTNFVTLGLEASGDAAYFKIKAGETFVIYSDDLDANNAVIAHGSIAFGDIVNIKAKADTATVDLEVFVAST